MDLLPVAQDELRLCFFQVNPDKVQCVKQKLEAFLAQEKEQKERAQRCFVSYLRSVYMMRNKEVFNVFKLPIREYALSLGLAVAPRVRFLSNHRAQKAGLEDEPPSDGDTQMGPLDCPVAESENEDVDNSSEALLGGISEDEDDLRDLELLTVKRKDVFDLVGDPESAEDTPLVPKPRTGKESKYKEAKKLLKRNFQVNTKIRFNEEVEGVQLWPPAQRAAASEEEEDEDRLGINMEKARERLRREDQEFDKQEYRRKVQAKHREKRLKAREARREASKRRESSQAGAHLDGDGEAVFDSSTLPDPDHFHSSEEEEDEGCAKRQRSSEDEEERLVVKRKKGKQLDDEHTGLDTGLSLAEDEELVLHLLAGPK